MRVGLVPVEAYKCLVLAHAAVRGTVVDEGRERVQRGPTAVQQVAVCRHVATL